MAFIFRHWRRFQHVLRKEEGKSTFTSHSIALYWAESRDSCTQPGDSTDILKSLIDRNGYGKQALLVKHSGRSGEVVVKSNIP